MNTVGRIFLVLNLLLAGTFVGFAGTFLKSQDNYKSQLETAQTEHSKEMTQLKDTLNTANNEKNNLDREKARLDTELSAVKNQLANAERENQRLDSQLSDIQGNYERVQGNTATMAQKITAAYDQSKEAFQLAVQSQNEKDEAIREKDQAVAELRVANQKIANLEGNTEDLSAQVATLEASIAEKDILITAAQAQGFNLLDAQPAMSGIVTMAEGDLITVQVNDNPTEMPIKKGYKFALYSDGGYKGDMTVTDVQDNYAIGRVFAKVENATIKVGDKASTDISNR